MKLQLIRKTFTEKSTIGLLSVDGVFECYTLEDKVRDVKIAGVTAIPYGVYKVILNYSNRFKKILPLLLEVENFEGVRIHSGNTDADTEGCILVGKTRGEDSIGNSKIALNDLVQKITLAIERKEEVEIEILKGSEEN
jgi:hypothetical protein